MPDEPINAALLDALKVAEVQDAVLAAAEAAGARRAAANDAVPAGGAGEPIS